jgi:hypothetical protein
MHFRLGCKLAALFSFLFLSACMSTQIVTKYDCNTIAKDETNRATAVTYFWGLKQPKDIDPKCQASFNHLNKVKVKTNFGYILLATVTLGIVVVQKWEWCCAPPNLAPETLGIRQPLILPIDVVKNLPPPKP